MQQIISLPGLYVDGSVITLDPTMWTTQVELTKKLKLKSNVVNNRVRRYIKAELIPDIYIEALGVRLIPNVNDINDLRDYNI